MLAAGKTLLVLAWAAVAGHGHCQTLYYLEPGVASCPPAGAASNAAAKPLLLGVAVTGGIRVNCGLDQGSYTVSLDSSDPRATFVPKTFLVNFGRVVGNGLFTVTFLTVGLQTISATITSNMGSPPARGQFEGADQAFKVVTP